MIRIIELFSSASTYRDWSAWWRLIYSRYGLWNFTRTYHRPHLSSVIHIPQLGRQKMLRTNDMPELAMMFLKFKSALFDRTNHCLASFGSVFIGTRKKWQFFVSLIWRTVGKHAYTHSQLIKVFAKNNSAAQIFL